jgi:DNA-binding transcriptional LysR family regulator
MARLSSELVHVLPDLVGPEADMYFVYPEELRDTKRINVFRDFLIRHIAESWTATAPRTHELKTRPGAKQFEAASD